MRILRRWKTWVAAAVLGLTVAAGIAVAAGTSSAPPHLANNPTVQACMNSGALYCNPTPGAQETFVAGNWYSGTPAPDAARTTEADALSRARGSNTVAPASAVLVPYSEIAAANPALAANATVNPQRMVWVVTVQADVMTTGGLGAPPQEKHVYSVVIDAESGGVTDACVGCEAVKDGQLVQEPTS